MRLGISQCMPMVCLINIIIYYKYCIILPYYASFHRNQLTPPPTSPHPTNAPSPSPE